jgi:gamma-glutamylcyclotransferase (GGCT)/AIG2-like uncharacterized protein YtfP
MSDTWYFAYGSNLSVDRKMARTGAIRKAVRCRLPAYRIAFNKRPDLDVGAYANIIPDASEAVWGVAYLCDEDAVAELDGYEGVSGGHYRHEIVEVVTDTGEVLRALAYTAGDDRLCEERRPTSTYLQRILEGARYHQLPEDYIELLEAFGSGPHG